MTKRNSGRISAAERSLIKHCAENGVGIDDLGNGSTFKFTPSSGARRLEDSGPSARGSVVNAVAPWVGKLKLRNWHPPRSSLDPHYSIEMAGDPRELTRARDLYSMGDPRPLRAYLAERKWTS